MVEGGGGVVRSSIVPREWFYLWGVEDILYKKQLLKKVSVPLMTHPYKMIILDTLVYINISVEFIQYHRKFCSED